MLARCLDALAPADRLLLSLRFEEGLSAAAIARSLRFPTPFHVYRRLDRLLKGLRLELKDQGVDGSEP